MNDNRDVTGIACAMFWVVFVMVLYLSLDIEAATVASIAATVILALLGSAGRENEYGPRGR